MARQELRLELLKLTYSHGRESSEAVERAKVLETYVLGETAKAAPAGDKTLKLPPKHLRRGNS
jgi:hypothetical protein